MLMLFTRIPEEYMFGFGVWLTQIKRGSEVRGPSLLIAIAMAASELASAHVADCKHIASNQYYCSQTFSDFYSLADVRRQKQATAAAAAG